MSLGADSRAEAFHRATDEVSDSDLEWMVLPLEDLPKALTDFEIGREGPLDNATMAEHGFPGQTVESIEEIGRITGYVREMIPSQLDEVSLGDVVTAGVVVHLFRDHRGVAQWIDDVFLKEFIANAGRIRDGGYELEHAEELAIDGFHGKSAAVFAVHGVPNGTLGSTIVDFAVGRVLGVAFVVVLGETQDLDLAKDLALKLERQVVSVALGSV